MRGQRHRIRRRRPSPAPVRMKLPRASSGWITVWGSWGITHVVGAPTVNLLPDGRRVLTWSRTDPERP